MRRPQSAKPGYKNYWGQGSQSDFQQNDNLSRGNHRKNIKLMKPDLTTNDFARILPKKIYQDKQRLYSQALQLKQNLNETIQQNIRLKTRITILQKQKDKLTKHIQVGRQTGGMNKANSRVNIYNNKSSQKENMMIRNLKKMVRQGKQQNQFLKQENAKIKKAIKYTKINQLQIQRKMLQQQNKRITNILEEMNNQLANQQSYEQQVNQLRRALQDQQRANQQLNQANLKSMEYIQELEEKLQSQAQKFHNKQNKMQRDVALNKRKMNEAIKQAQSLRKQLNTYKQQSLGNSKNDANKKAKLTRPMSSNTYKGQGGLIGVRMATETKKQQGTNKQNQQQMKDMKLQNQQLKQQLNRTKSKLQQTQRQIKKQKQKQQLANNQQQLNKQSNKDSKKNNFVEPTQTKQKSRKAIPQQKTDKTSKNNKSQVQKQQNYDQYNEYQNEFDNSPTKKDEQNQYAQQSYQKMDDAQQISRIRKSTDKKGSVAENRKSELQNEKHIDQFRKDFEEEEEEQPLYIKEEQGNNDKKKKKSVKNQQKQGKKKKQKVSSTTTYKPDKKILTQIKQILTYRMKAQRYPFEELKRDIKQANQKQFSLTDLQGMFINQPFYLTQKYTDSLIEYCYEKQKPKATQTVSSEVLLTKLKKMIENFTLVQEKQEQQMLLRIAQMVTQYPQELEQAFEKIKNGQQTVAKAGLIEMFTNLELQAKYIELIIQELSLCSVDLQHLNYIGFFQRFYVQNMQGVQNGQIDEEQMQSSSQQVSRNLKSKDIKKLKQVKQQFQDDDQNLVEDDGQKISLGNNQNEEYRDDDIVSDDGPV